MSISRALFRSDGPLTSRRLQNLRPSDCADGTSREASIMSISRVLFRSDGPLTSRRLQNPSPQ